MQNITIYLRADSVNARVVDSFNQILSTPPAITRGMRNYLILKLLDGEGAPLTGLNGFSSWDFVIANDWITSTPPQIRSRGVSVNNNEIRIFLDHTNTEELIGTLGNQPYMNLGAELAGFETGETTPGFLIQFDIQIRNRRSEAGSGTPVPVGDGSYSAGQINALIAGVSGAQRNVQYANVPIITPADKCGVVIWRPWRSETISFDGGVVNLSSKRLDFELEITPMADVVLTFADDVIPLNAIPEQYAKNSTSLFRVRSLAGGGWLLKHIHTHVPADTP